MPKTAWSRNKPRWPGLFFLPWKSNREFNTRQTLVPALGAHFLRPWRDFIAWSIGAGWWFLQSDIFILNQSLRFPQSFLFRTWICFTKAGNGCIYCVLLGQFSPGQLCPFAGNNPSQFAFGSTCLAMVGKSLAACICILPCWKKQGVERRKYIPRLNWTVIKSYGCLQIPVLMMVSPSNL